jgi:hypothetical protein
MHGNTFEALERHERVPPRQIPPPTGNVMIGDAGPNRLEGGDGRHEIRGLGGQRHAGG